VPPHAGTVGHFGTSGITPRRGAKAADSRPVMMTRTCCRFLGAGSRQVMNSEATAQCVPPP
jgi:hypothetical protein